VLVCLTRPFIVSHLPLEHAGWHLLGNDALRHANGHAKNIALFCTAPDDVVLKSVCGVATTEACVDPSCSAVASVSVIPNLRNFYIGLVITTKRHDRY